MIGKLLVAVILLMTGLLYYLAKLEFPTTSLLLVGAQLSGLYGLVLLSLSFFLAIRHQLLERLFGGLDKVYKIHHILGGISFLLVLEHPLLLIVNSLPNNLLGLYLLPGQMWDYNAGILALYLLIVLIFLTLYVDLPYYIWKKTHEWMGLVIILGGIHGFLVSSDMSRYMPLRIWMLGLVAFAILAFVYKRYLYYFLLPKQNYLVSKISQEAGILVVQLQAKTKQLVIPFEPGQYGFLTIPLTHRERDEHPFSVMGMKGDKLTFGIKVIGQHTLAMSRLDVGTVVTVRGPYGTFAQSLYKAKNMVWVAGGIGITPFFSMREKLSHEQKVTMWYSSREVNNITQPFIDYQKTNPLFRLIENNSPQGGRLTGQRIIENNDPKSTKFFLCGPLEMMKSLTTQLCKLGVPAKHIIFEDFGFK